MHFGHSGVLSSNIWVTLGSGACETFVYGAAMILSLLRGGHLIGSFHVVRLLFLALRWWVITVSWLNCNVVSPSPDIALHRGLANWILTCNWPVSRFSWIISVHWAILVIMISSTIQIFHCTLMMLENVMTVGSFKMIWEEVWHCCETLEETCRGWNTPHLDPYGTFFLKTSLSIWYE
jgi:hypothetical protein